MTYVSVSFDFAGKRICSNRVASVDLLGGLDVKMLVIPDGLRCQVLTESFTTTEEAQERYRTIKSHINFSNLNDNQKGVQS